MNTANEVREYLQKKAEIAQKYRRLFVQELKSEMYAEGIGNYPNKPSERTRERWSQKGNASKMPLRRSFVSSVRKKGGDVERIRIGFGRQGIWTEYGVGRGYKIGSIRANGAGYGRRPKPWINQAIDAQMPGFANEMTQVAGDVVLNTMRITSPARPGAAPSTN